MIGENLRRKPNDPGWLQAKGRAELLDGNNDDAVKSLERALESKPDSASLLADTGTAYYLRGKSTNQAIDYGRAVEYLGKALSKTPDDPVALFNHALACEQIYLYLQAIDDWEHYLRLDAQGEWADEARKRLAIVHEKTQKHEHSQVEPLLEPRQVAKAGATDNEIRASVDDRIEQYLRIAVVEWLPRAFPTSVSKTPSTDEKAALVVLASVLREEHDDSWLTDLLSHSANANFPAGLKALSESIVADERGDYSSAHSLAQTASRLFREAFNPAGELRAQAEEVYADHLLYEGDACLSLLRKLEIPLKQSTYAWLQAQMSLEQSNCADLVGNLGTYQRAIDQGIAEATDHRYNALLLRGLGFKAQAVSSSGDAKTGFSLAFQGLSTFWSHDIDLMKGYNLYTDMDTAADEIHLPILQITIWKEATALIDKHSDILQRAMAHRWYANAAYMANMPTLAIDEFRRPADCYPKRHKQLQQPAIIWTQKSGLQCLKQDKGIWIGRPLVSETLNQLLLPRPVSFRKSGLRMRGLRSR